MYLIITDPTLPLLCLSFVAVFLLSQLTNLLGSVMNKYITDTKTRPRDKVAPVKITRRGAEPDNSEAEKQGEG